MPIIKDTFVFDLAYQADRHLSISKRFPLCGVPAFLRRKLIIIVLSMQTNKIPTSMSVGKYVPRQSIAKHNKNFVNASKVEFLF